MRFWQEVDGRLVRLAAEQADKLQDAFAKSVDVNSVVADFLRTHTGDEKVTAKQARDWTQLHVSVNSKPILAVLRESYATAYALGLDSSLAAYAHARLTKAADTQPSGDDLRAAMQFDWKTWKAGDKPAALLLKPPKGLANLLSRANTTVTGLNDTTLSRLGTVLSEGLARGAGSDAVARQLMQDDALGALKSASRMQTIAVTEMARATQVAQMENYQSFGVEYVEWLDIDADDDCATNAEQGAIPIGQEFDSGDTEPPAHPNCRCAVVPAFPDDAELPALGAGEVLSVSEGETDHSDAIAQGIEAVATELHPDMAVETTGLETAAPEVAATESNGLDIARLLADDTTNDERLALLRSAFDGKDFNGFRVEVSGAYMSGTNEMEFRAFIKLPDGRTTGNIERTISKSDLGYIVNHDLLTVDSNFRGQGFGSAFSNYSETLYKNSGVTKITLQAGLKDGAYTWAKAGYQFDKEPIYLKQRLASDKISELASMQLAGKITPEEFTAIQTQIENLADILNTTRFTDPSYPTPFEIANLQGPKLNGMDFGKWLLENMTYNGYKEIG
jgi:GNAT superfamily N-acetyltransferase